MVVASPIISDTASQSKLKALCDQPTIASDGKVTSVNFPELAARETRAFDTFPRGPEGTLWVGFGVRAIPSSK